MSESPEVRARRVLLIEDEEAFRELIELALRRAGYDVVAVADGSVARRLLATNRYDAIVSDVCMPGVDGFELLTELREKKNAIPIVVMSGGVDGETGYVLKMALLLGAKCILRKPFPIGDLLTALDALCRR